MPLVSKTLLSTLLNISRRGLYKEDSYGHRRIALALGMGKKRIRRVMRKFGIKPYKQYQTINEVDIKRSG